MDSYKRSAKRFGSNGRAEDDFPNEYEYLTLLNDIAEFADCMSGLYGLEQRRVKLHKRILNSLSWKCDIDDPATYQRSKAILGNLDTAIGFIAPQKVRYIECYELNRLLNCQEAEYYMTGKIQCLNTSYGIIE